MNILQLHHDIGRTTSRSSCVFLPMQTELLRDVKYATLYSQNQILVSSIYPTGYNTNLKPVA